MNQLVAPTSFITETSRRREKIAIRIVLRIRTVAESKRTSARERKTICRIRMARFISRICCSGAVTVYTPGWWMNVDCTVKASDGTVGTQLNFVGISETVSTFASDEVQRSEGHTSELQ